MKYLILSLMLTFSALAQTKFIKEYHYKFIVDKGISAQTVDSLVSIANSALKNVDKDGYGLRIVNDGIQDTLNLGDDEYVVKDSLSKLIEKDYLAYITRDRILNRKRSPLGGVTRNLKGLYFVLSEIKQSGYRLAHEVGHTMGVGHTPESLNLDTMGWANDIMSTNTYDGLTPEVYPSTKKMFWERLLNTQFYDFKKIE